MQEQAEVEFGFASFEDNSFELIVRNRATRRDTTLCGDLKPGQIEQLHEVLPTCVFIRVDPESDRESDRLRKLILEFANHIEGMGHPATAQQMRARATPGGGGPTIGRRWNAGLERV